MFVHHVVPSVNGTGGPLYPTCDRVCSGGDCAYLEESWRARDKGDSSL